MQSRTNTLLLIIAALIILAVVLGVTWAAKNGKLMTSVPGGIVTPTPTLAVPTSGQISPTIQASPAEQQVLVSLVSLGEGTPEAGSFGCGDMIFNIPKMTTASAEVNKVSQALTALLVMDEQRTTYQGEELYNALANSDLAVDRIEPAAGVLNVYLTGEISQGGVCDSPRIDEQLRSTVTANSDVDSVEIFINDEPISEVLSLR